MKRKHLLIKPASSNCNMRCKYCFYADEAQNRKVQNFGIMSKEIAHTVIERTISEADDVTFSFQGGEPTLASLDFFKDFVSYATAIKEKKVVHFTIQTNGYIIDREWAKFFHDNNFLVGLSLDGNKAIHDIYRRDCKGEGSFKKAFRTSQYFQTEEVDFNILVTVTKDVSLNIERLYAFFKKNNFRFQQYIACIDPIAEERGSLDYSLTPELFGKFLCTLFDLYFKDWQNEDFVSIRYFDNLVLRMAGLKVESCGMLGFCPKNYVLEADGSVYPCDFYVLDNYKIGNLTTDSFALIDENRENLKFTEKSCVIDEKCKTCTYFPICLGGCRRDREDFNTGEIKLSFLCQSYKFFFSQAMERLEYMGQKERESRSL
ncbi:anaerobic sulfatase maturase [uncultured Sphaerochaeta sp.]|uniref:anaerobic sulfatase maturase n=1 Tax=uncultured Sphaerochaeta sp. TaxID=886478 RepID=UPI002A0A7956|nr:anaerobic sulfatase maturase [uncultured Sphaerochaeta sp.]